MGQAFDRKAHQLLKPKPEQPAAQHHLIHSLVTPSWPHPCQTTLTADTPDAPPWRPSSAGASPPLTDIASSQAAARCSLLSTLSPQPDVSSHFLCRHFRSTSPPPSPTPNIPPPPRVAAWADLQGASGGAASQCQRRIDRRSSELAPAAHRFEEGRV